MKSLPRKVKRIRVYIAASVRMVPQLGIDTEKDKVEMELTSMGVAVDQGAPFGVKLIPFANILEVDFLHELKNDN